MSADQHSDRALTSRDALARYLNRLLLVETDEATRKKIETLLSDLPFTPDDQVPQLLQSA